MRDVHIHLGVECGRHDISHVILGHFLVKEGQLIVAPERLGGKASGSRASSATMTYILRPHSWLLGPTWVCCCLLLGSPGFSSLRQQRTTLSSKLCTPLDSHTSKLQKVDEDHLCVWQVLNGECTRR